MRYAHIVRRNAQGLPAASATASAQRKFRPITKRANTAALDAAQSLRRSLPVVVLLTLPFLVAVYHFIFHHVKRSSSDRLSAASVRDAAELPAVPSQFARFEASAVRNELAAASASSGQRGAADTGSGAPVAAPIGPTLTDVDIPTYAKRLASRRKFKVDPGASVSLIAACKDRTESLSLSLSSWEAVPQIDQIVVVDWSSATPPSWHDTPRMYGLVRSGRLTLALVQNAGPWVLSRAYNLAATLATGSHILKVDCDTHLDKNVLTSVRLPSSKEYYSVPYDDPRTPNEARLRGVFLARKDVFHAAGGFDERVTGYGHEDTDLYERFHSDMGLTLRSFDLSRLRHNIVNHIVWHRNDSASLTRHVSARLNEALVKELPRWRGLHAGMNGTYSLRVDASTGVLLAKVKRSAPDALAALPDTQREALRVKMLRTALHDDFSLPWDIVPTLSHADLEYLAWRLDASEADSESRTRVVVAVLDGPTVLANLFNLVSAARLAIKLRRPVIVCWNRPSVRADNVIARLLDVTASNAQLLAAAGGRPTTDRSAVGPRGEHDVRLIAAGRWPCSEGLGHCGEKYDVAYKAFSEVLVDGQTVYDERDETPVSTSKHALIRLGASVKIGNRADRIAVYKALVQGHVVRSAQQQLGVNPKLAAVVAHTNSAVNVSAQVRKKLGMADGAKTSSETLTVVGDGAAAARHALFGADHEAAKGYCEEEPCSLEQTAREMAGALGASVAESVVPEHKVDDERRAWLRGGDVATVTALMVEDLRALQRG